MVVSLWSRDFFPPLYFDPRFRPLLLKYIYTVIVFVCILNPIIDHATELPRLDDQADGLSSMV